VKEVKRVKDNGLFDAVMQQCVHHRATTRFTHAPFAPAERRVAPQQFVQSLRSQRFRWKLVSRQCLPFLFAFIVRFACDKENVRQWVREAARAFRRGYLLKFVFYDPKLGELVIQPFVGFFLILHRTPLERAFAILQQKRELALAQRSGNYVKVGDNEYFAIFELEPSFEEILEVRETRLCEILGETETRAPPSRSATALFQTSLVLSTSAWLSPQCPRAIVPPPALLRAGQA